MLWLFLVKLLVVVFFLVMFVRGARLVWGIGLLTVTTALLLDSLVQVFGSEAILADVGYFQDVVRGVLFGGAALWLWGVLRPYVGRPAGGGRAAAGTAGRTMDVEAVWPADGRSRPDDEAETAFDRQMLYDQIRYRLGPADILDLIFDLQINENDVIQPNDTMARNVIRLMDLAEQRRQVGELALAVERILTPVPAENLPRLEKLSADSPPTVLRHYLLAHFTLGDLAGLAGRLDVDWEALAGSSKQEKVRSLLLYLYRRNRIGDLLLVLRETG